MRLRGGDAGVRALRDGDDFADVAIAIIGAADGAMFFASVDRQAMALATRLGLTPRRRAGSSGSAEVGMVGET
jgi:hypothetical protein